MADQTPVQKPEVKPGMFIWTGRFRNRPAVVSRVWNENGKVKFEIIPVPQGRKHPKERNLLPFKPMNAEDTEKYKAIYEDERKKRENKKTAVAVRYSRAKASQTVEDSEPAGVTVWASENGMCRIQDMGSGPQRFQSLYRVGSVWCEEIGWPSLKEALRDLRLAKQGS